MTRFSALAFGLAAVGAALAAPVSAKDSLGVFNAWAAFRDPAVPRCYAIAKPEDPVRKRDLERRDYAPYASVGTWPKHAVRNQVHFRLSRELSARPAIRLTIGSRSFALTGGGGDGWSQDKTMDAAIVAAMRSANRMTVSATDKRGNRFSDRYSLRGAPTAIDAATIGCSRNR